MKNNYETIGEVTRIYFRNCDDYMLIDTEDFEKVSKHTWYKDSWGYGHSFINGKHKRCHNLIMGKAPDGLVTDHINRNKLDNRKENLRFCSHYVNTHNRDPYVKQRKIFRDIGIRYRHGVRVETYSVEVKDNNGKTIYIGSYRTLDKALEIRERTKELFCKGELTPFQIKKLRNAQ